MTNNHGTNLQKCILISFTPGKEDTMWAQYVQEVDEWLYSKDFNKGQALFKEVEGKIMAELSLILKERRNTERRRKLLVSHYVDSLVDAHRRLEEQAQATPANSRLSLPGIPHQRHLSSSVETNFTQLKVDLEHEHEVYHGTEDRSDRVYVYLAADNERVKEAFAAYLLNHTHISVMRVHTNDIIVHAKNTGKLFLWISCFFFFCCFVLVCYTPKDAFRLILVKQFAICFH